MSNNKPTTEEVLHFLVTEVVTAKEAIEITGQTRSGFYQSVAAGYVQPFYKAHHVMLFLRKDVEAYAKTKRSK